jgi:hypothetical protein
MRRSFLVAMVVVAGCADPGHDEYEVIGGFLERSPTVTCSAIAPGPELAVTEIQSATDSTVLVLDGPGRRLVELDDGLGEVWSMSAPGAGPGSFDAPVDAVALGDSAVAVAERAGLRLMVYRRTGELLRTVDLPFVPAAMAAEPSGTLLLTPMALGGRPGSLLFRYDGDDLREVGIPPRHYADMVVSALGNTTKVGVLESGAAIVVHQFLSPRGFRVDPSGQIEQLRVPTPDATREHLAFIPAPPITEDQVSRILVPVIAMSVDRRRGEVYVVTRSGRMNGGDAERAILRLDERLGLLESFIIGMSARGIAYLPARDIAIVVDNQDRFHSCHLPREDRRHARTD